MRSASRYSDRWGGPSVRVLGRLDNRSGGEHRHVTCAARLASVEKCMWKAALPYILKGLGLYETLAAPIADKAWNLNVKAHLAQAIV